MFLGFFLVPEGGIWNYHFNGAKHNVSMKYNLVLENPKSFHDSVHRPLHYLNFVNTEPPENEILEREDLYS